MTYKEIKIIAALSGVGKVNAAMTTVLMISSFSPDAIVNVGCAGGFRNNQKVLDIVIADSFVYTDVDITNLGFAPGQLLNEERFFPADPELINILKNTLSSDILSKHAVHYGPVGSADSFIRTKQQITKIQQDFETVLCVEMEGCAIAHVCKHCNTPLLSIRTLSDIAVSDEDNTSDFQSFLEEASKLAANICINLLDSIL